MMFDVDSITDQVLLNCRICDARHAGLYSICGLALRLRDLYKWEMGLDPWIEKDSSEILDWIGAKEEIWEGLYEAEFNEITVLDRKYDPFDTPEINRLLEPHGLFYGAGYAGSLRPTFLLAVLEEKKEMEGSTLYVLGRELARDLLTVPALTQGTDIILRRQSVPLFLWNQIFFVKQSGRQALQFALSQYGIENQDLKSLHPHLSRISEDQMDTYVHHELGEIRDRVFDRQLWREILACFPHTPVELLARSIKDLLADTHEEGTLRHLARGRKAASLALFVAFFDGLRKAMFPQLSGAFAEFTRTGNWRIIEEAVATGHDITGSYAEEMSGIYLAGKRKNDLKWAKREIEKRLLAPLGIGEPDGAEGRDLG